MKRIGLSIALLALLAFVLPSLTAQDGKKDAAKDEKKEDAPKTDKKDKDNPAKDDAKEKPETKKPEKFVYGSKFVTKIMSMGGGSNREFTVELRQPDPQKVFEYNRWYSQRTVELARQQSTALTQQNPNTRIQQLATYQRDVANFQVDAAKRAANLTMVVPLEVRAAENATVRTLLPPIEFDDLGFQKKWTRKELEERRDKTGLPGFAVDFEALKQGQYVEIYLPKQVGKKTPTKKKGPAEDDPPAVKMGQEFLLIVIRQEPGK